MRIIAVYDIGEKRVSKVRKVFLKFLNPVQFSVFEGDLTEASYRKLRNQLSGIIDNTYDSIIFFCMDNPKWMIKEVMGVEKNDLNNIL